MLGNGTGVMSFCEDDSLQQGEGVGKSEAVKRVPASCSPQISMTGGSEAPLGSEHTLALWCSAPLPRL